MDIELQESVDKFRQLTGLAHFCYESHKHKFNTQQEKIANQLFLKICLSLDSTDKILPQENQLPLLNISSLWIFARVLMEEEITFSYLFNQTLTAEEKDFRFDLYNYHGVADKYKFLKQVSTENSNDDESLKTKRIEEFSKCEKEIEQCKANLNKSPFIKKIPKNDDHYEVNKILKGKYPKYIKLEKLFIDSYSGYRQIYAAYILGSSYIHSSSFALNKLSTFEQNLKEQNYDNFKMVMQFIRISAAKSINLYRKIFDIDIAEKYLSDLTF